MNLNEYQALAMRSESYRSTVGLSLSEKDTELLNAALGLSDEAGEFSGHLKKVLFHGHKLNLTDFIEEAGDVLWYLAQAAKAIGITLEEIGERNIEKLKIRYPEKFEDHKSINRNLQLESAAFDSPLPSSNGKS